MGKNTKIKALGYCRRCLNEEFGINLKQKDVYTYQYPYQCRRCKETKWIVAKVRPVKAWKLWSARGLQDHGEAMD